MAKEHTSEIVEISRIERESCAEIVERGAGIAHDDWNDRNLARQYDMHVPRCFGASKRPPRAGQAGLVPSPRERI